MKLKTCILIALCILLTVSSLFAQQKIKVIRANSKTVDIKDGNNLKKATWTIVPSARPDIYKTSAKRVTFYTDLDSISFKSIPT